MTRQVDIKALISHIVRGDGGDKCRICMGDTSEGQVYLGDTIMMDDEKPVTLAELLESITGVTVEHEEELPQGICRACSEASVAAMLFRQLYKESAQQWTKAIAALSQTDNPSNDDKAYYIFYNGDHQTVVRDQVDGELNVTEVLKRINESFTEHESLPKISKRKKKTNYKFTNSSNCPDCGKKFNNAQDLNVHLKKSMKRVCRQCGIIVDRSKLAKHLIKSHETKLFECSLCHKLFEEENSLFEHKSLYHGMQSYICNVCSKGYMNDRALRTHMYSHTLFHCTYCTQTFENRRCYKHHEKQCKKVDRPVETEFICDHCGNVYTKKPSLRIHIVQKHLNVLPFVCQTCGKRTSTLAHLRSHEKTHKTERTVFRCICGATMRTELGYQLHLRIHTGEKPYECQECGQKFLSASRRLDHIKRRHRSTQDMAHGCDMCPARFVRPFELKKHYASVHCDNQVSVPPLSDKKSIAREL